MTFRHLDQGAGTRPAPAASVDGGTHTPEQFEQWFAKDKQKGSKPNFISGLGQRVAAQPATDAVKQPSMPHNAHQFGDICDRKSFRSSEWFLTLLLVTALFFS